MRFWWTGWDDSVPWVICVACSCVVEGGGGPFCVADCDAVAGAGCVTNSGVVAGAECATEAGVGAGAESGTEAGVGAGAVADSGAESGVGAVADFGAECGAGLGPYSLGRRGQVFLKWPICIHMPHFFLTPDLFTDITFLSFFFNSQASTRLFFFGLPGRILFCGGKTSGYSVTSHWCCPLVGYIIGW